MHNMLAYVSLFVLRYSHAAGYFNQLSAYLWKAPPHKIVWLRHCNHNTEPNCNPITLNVTLTLQPYYFSFDMVDIYAGFARFLW